MGFNKNDRATCIPKFRDALPKFGDSKMAGFGVLRYKGLL